MQASHVATIRALVEEGALSKAAKMLIAQGLADSENPVVEKALRELHPPPQPHMVAVDALPSAVQGNLAGDMEEAEKAEVWEKRVWSAITSFPPGSAGGPSGLRPTHLKEICRKLGPGTPVVAAIGVFVEVAVTTTFPASVREVLCASSLIPLQKKDGGVRPIAVGDTLRRVIGKCLLGSEAVKTELACLRPRQCGVGVKNAAEMVGMGLQRFVQSKAAQGDHDYVVLQVDMRNAFNSISRNAVLKGCKEKVPSAYNWLKFCYGGASPLYCQGRFFCNSHIEVHQGDACRPLGFAPGLEEGLDQCEQRDLEWESWYLDDGHIVGVLPNVLARLKDLREALSKVGLSLNLEKCKLWGPGMQTHEQPTPRYPDDLAMDNPWRQVPVIALWGERGITALGVPIDAPKGAARQEPFVAPAQWTSSVEQTKLLLSRLRAYPEGQVGSPCYTFA